MNSLDELTRDYRTALLRFLSTGSEESRVTGYEIGRRAMESGVSLLDLARVHHELLVETLRERPVAEYMPLTTNASEFFLEVLSTFDMAHHSHRDVTSGEA
jgi:hypothetical protein